MARTGIGNRPGPTLTGVQGTLREDQAPIGEIPDGRGRVIQVMMVMCSRIRVNPRGSRSGMTSRGRIAAATIGAVGEAGTATPTGAVPENLRAARGGRGIAATVSRCCVIRR